MKLRHALTALCALACLALPAPGQAGAQTRNPRAAAQKRAARRAVKSDRAPRAIGPYSQAIVANGFVFAAGQIGVDPRRANSSPAASGSRPNRS